jgi:hypothetical protein
MIGKHGEWEVETVWGAVSIYAHAGKVGIQGLDSSTLPAAQARAIGEALTMAAVVSEAQAAVRSANDEAGSTSPEANAARESLRRLQQPGAVHAGTWRTSVPLHPVPDRAETRHAPKTYWCDFRFTRRATSRRAVERRVSKLIAAGRNLGFEFEQAVFGRDELPPFP